MTAKGFEDLGPVKNTDAAIEDLGPVDQGSGIEDLGPVESSKVSPDSNPMKQFGLGLTNSILMNFPIFALEKTTGGGKAVEAVRDYALDEPDTTAEHVGRVVGELIGFGVGLPAKVFIKGGNLALKAAAHNFPELMKTGTNVLKTGKQLKSLTRAQQMKRTAIQGAGGFTAYEALTAPEEQYVEKAVTIPLAAALGASFGLTGEALKGPVSRFVSKLTKGKRSAFTEELANSALTEVDRVKLKFNSKMNKRDFNGAQSVVTRMASGKMKDQMNTELDVFRREVTQQILDRYPFETVRHLAKLKNDNILKQVSISAREHIKGQGVAANLFVQKSDAAFVNGMTKSGQEITSMLRKTAGLTDDEFENLVASLNGNKSPMNDVVEKVMGSVRKDFDRIAAEAKAAGVNLAKRADYFPHVTMKHDAPKKVVDYNLKQAVKQGDFDNIDEAWSVWRSYKNFMQGGDESKIENGRHRIIAYIKKKTNMKEEEIVRLLKDEMVRAKSAKYHNLESPRKLNLPFWDRDFVRASSSYLEGASNRIEVAKQFGADDSIAKKLVAEAAAEGADKKLMETAYNRMFGIHEDPGLFSGVTRRTFQMAKNFEIVTKLSLAAIPNSSQSLNTAYITGIAKTMRGIMDMYTKKGKAFADETGAILQTTIDDMLRRSTSGTSSFTAKFLKGVGFTWTERGNRMVAANAGRYHVESLASRVLKNNGDKRAIRGLQELGLDYRKIIKKNGVSWDDTLRGANMVVNKTQFQSQALDLPILWSSPAGRVISQFKTFSFNQGKLMKDALLGEALKGNMKPLAIAVAAMPIAGEGVADLRAVLSGKERGAGLDRLVENIVAVGGIGIFSDMWSSARYGDLEGFLIGPFLSTAVEGGESVYHTLRGKPKMLVQSVLNRIPFSMGKRIAKALE